MGAEPLCVELEVVGEEEVVCEEVEELELVVGEDDVVVPEEVVVEEEVAVPEDDVVPEDVLIFLAEVTDFETFVRTAVFFGTGFFMVFFVVFLEVFGLPLPALTFGCFFAAAFDCAFACAVMYVVFCCADADCSTGGFGKRQSRREKTSRMAQAANLRRGGRFFIFLSPHT